LSCSPDTPTSTLFVADLPFNISEAEVAAIFHNQKGFKSSKLRKDKNGSAIAFVEFEDIITAAQAKENCQGYKMSMSDKGLAIQFSRSAVQSPKPRASRHDNEQGRVSNNNRGGFPMAADISPFYSHFPPSPTAPFSPFGPHLNPFNNSPLPADSSNVLFVEGLPYDCSAREAAHIFRQWSGYQSLRVVPKESKTNPSRVFNLCFVEFDNKYQATLALHNLQGYRMDKNDTQGLSISYAKTQRKDRREREETINRQ